MSSLRFYVLAALIAIPGTSYANDAALVAQIKKLQAENSQLKALLGAKPSVGGASTKEAVSTKPTTSAKSAVSGYFGVQAGSSAQNFNFDPDGWQFAESWTHPYPYGNVFVLGTGAAVNSWIDDKVSIQFSADAQGTSNYKSAAIYDHDSYAQPLFNAVTGAHLAMRDPSSYAIGVLGGFTGATNLGVSDGEYNNGYNIGGIAGLESQKYIGPVTLYVQGGMGRQFNETDHIQFDDYWFSRGVARYFTDENSKLSAEVGYAKGGSTENGSDYKASILSWGASFEHKLSASAWSFFAAYSGEKLSVSAPSCQTGAITQHSVMIGAKLNFGSGSLFDADRNGATFEMPKFQRATGWTDMAEDGAESFCEGSPI